MSAYLDSATDGYIIINADSTAGRRSRAAQVNAAKRRYEAAHDITLTLVGKSYSETAGFLSRSSFRYQVTDSPPTAGPAPAAWRDRNPETEPKTTRLGGTYGHDRQIE
jgi:hypothetical protein